MEARWTPILDEWVAASYAVREATRDEQWRGIDRIASADDGDHSLDYKCDERAAHTGKAFIELLSNRQSGRAGWAVTSEAEWLLYFVASHEVLVLRFEVLRERLPRWCTRYPLRSAKNEGYETRGVLVPLAEMREACEYIARLDCGDCCVLEPRDDNGDEL